MSILKFKNADGTWNGIAAFKGEPGKDGAIQYQAGFGINISEDNVISSTLDPDDDITVDTNPTEGSVNPVSSGGVYTALAGKANTTYVDDAVSNIDIGGNADPYTYYMTSGISTSSSFYKGYRIDLTTAMKTELGAILTDAYAKSKRRIRLCVILNATPIIFETGINSSVPSITNKPSELSLNAMVRTSKPYDTGTTSDYLRDFNNTLLALTVNITWSDDNIATISSGEIRSVTGSQDLASTTYYNKYFLPRNNTESYTPTGNYNPATKKYVDDTVAASGGITEETDPTVPVWVKGITENDITNWNNKITSSDLPSDLGDLTNNAGYTTATDVLSTIHVNADLVVVLMFSSITESYYTNLDTENITFENFNKDALDALIRQELVKLIDEGYDPNEYPDSYMLPIKTFSIQTYIPITAAFNKVTVDKTDETGHNEVYESNINDPYLQDHTRYIASRMFGVISSIYIECYTQDLTERVIDYVTIQFNVTNVASSAGPTPGGRIRLRFNGNYISDSNITLGELTHMWPLTDTSLASNQTTDIQFSLNSMGHYLLMVSGKQESDIQDSEYYELGFKLTLDHYMGYSIAEFIKHHRRFGFTNTSLGVSISNFLAADNYHTKVNALLNFDGLSRPAADDSMIYIQYRGNVLVGKDPLKYTSLSLKLVVNSDTYELLEVCFNYDYPLTKAFEPYYTAGYDSSKTQTLKNVEGTLTWVDD